MFEYSLQHVLNNHRDPDRAWQSSVPGVLKWQKANEPGQLKYLQAVPLGFAIVLAAVYGVDQVIRHRKISFSWTQPFIRDEPYPDDGATETKRPRPSILWTLTLALLAVIAISLELILLLKTNDVPISTILSLSSWVVSFLIVVLNRPRYCPGWILLFYVSSFVIELSTIPYWTNLRDLTASTHAAIALVDVLSMAVVLSMQFKPTSPASGPIGTVGTAPSHVDRSPEDSLRLWQFFSASWVWPLLMVGKKRQLEKEDVWKLGYSFQNGRVIEAFRDVKGSSLVRRLIRANALDCCILFVSAFVGLISELASPILFQQLLIAIESPFNKNRDAVMFALLIFVRGGFSAQLASFSMWFGRRCYERTRGELIMTVYEKAVSRKIITMQGPANTSQNGSTGGAKLSDNHTNGHSNGSPSNSEASTLTNGSLENSTEDAKKHFYSSLLDKLKRLRSFLSSHKNTENQVIKHASAGQILNLVRTDADDVAKRFLEITRMVEVPLGIVFTFSLIWHLLGPSSLAALAVIVVAQAINALLARLQMSWSRFLKKATDERVQMNSQFIQVIRHLRYYGWEEQWLAKVMATRRDELNVRLVRLCVNISMYICTVCSSSFVPVVAFFAYTAFGGHQLRIDLIFPAIQLFKYLQNWLRAAPTLITSFLNASVSMGRIENFLKEPENEKIHSNRANQGNDTTPTLSALKFVDCTFVWPGVEKKALENASFVVNPGVNLVHGPVGSGKTALLQAILGELDLVSGDVDIPDELIAYCSQTPWLQSISIRDNILFFSPYEEERYQRVLEACALLPDLSEFKDGDLSQIGENGIGLSGGQRARVGLARAIYSKAKILLLDDPLSALDHQTAESIVQNCFASDLIMDKIVVLVTHRTGLVHHLARQSIGVLNGQVKITTDNPFLKEKSADEVGEVSKTPLTAIAQEDQKAYGTETSDKFIDEEKRHEGGIRAKVWLTFIEAGKWWWLLLVMTMVFARLTSVAQTWFFKSWGEAYGENTTMHTSLAQFSPHYSTVELEPPSQAADLDSFISLDPIKYLPSPNDDLKPWLYLLLLVSVVQSISFALYAVSQLTAIFKTSKNLYAAAIRTVTHASFRFYDITPIGRIMNRLTSDIQILDNALAYFGHTIFYSSLFISSITVIASVSPLFLLFSAGLMGIFVLVFQQFLPASRSLKRLESASLSPIYTIFDELLQNQGLTTVRAFHAQGSFHDRFVTSLDTYQGYGHFYNGTQIWLMFRYENLSCLSTFLMTMLALGTKLSPGLTAFMLINASNFIAATQTLCTQLADLQTEFISVERIVDLIETEQEPKGTLHPPASWPQYGGDIIFDNVTIRYAPHLEPSLHNISLHIPGGSTTACIGRTGSGKSTLASALLNIVRAETGSISIDNVSLTNINVHTLRRRITFVPQDPVLFLGTVRQNLDPVDEFTDEECQVVLDRVCAEAASQSWKLDTHVESGGKNLSQGQRQLIGITRAVLRRSPVVVLDEATASIDLETSVKLQRILREELKQATIIVIAHRPEAVEGVDYCVVLQNGRVLRQGKMDGESMGSFNEQVE